MPERQPGVLQVPPRDIPVPGHLSPEAQAWLSMPPREAVAYPALDDTDGWRRHIAASDAMILQLYTGHRSTTGYTVSQFQEGVAHGFEVVPAGVDPADRRVYFDIHGGALIMGAGELCKAFALDAAGRLGVRVVAVDYRMPPDHPFPAALDDCLAVYRMLLRRYDPAEIIIGGAAVFLKTLETFGQPALYYSAAGVRDGIIADLAARGVGRDRSRLSREQREVVEALSRRYGVGQKHAKHVAALAHELFEALQPLHRLPASVGKLLEASSYLHDIGHFVSDTSHHKHSAYLVANSDLPGFTDQERSTIAALCRFHRKSMPQTRHAEYQTLDADSKRAVLYLAPLLRLADALDRSQEQKVRAVAAAVKNGTIGLTVEAEPLADLELWAAGELTNIFKDVYGHELAVRRARG